VIENVNPSHNQHKKKAVYRALSNQRRLNDSGEKKPHAHNGGIPAAAILADPGRNQSPAPKRRNK